MSIGVGDTITIRGLRWNELTRWRKIWWRVRHPFRRYPQPIRDGVYVVTEVD